MRRERLLQAKLLRQPIDGLALELRECGARLLLLNKFQQRILGPRCGCRSGLPSPPGRRTARRIRRSRPRAPSPVSAAQAIRRLLDLFGHRPEAIAVQLHLR